MMSLPVYKANDFIGLACSFTDRILRTPKWFQIFFFCRKKVLPWCASYHYNPWNNFLYILHLVWNGFYSGKREVMWESIGERFCDVFVALIKFLSGRVPAFRGDDKLWAHRVWQLSRTVGTHCPVWSLLKRALGEVQSKGKRHFILPVIYRVWWAHLVFNVQWFNGKKVKRRIASELQLAKYFSISTDLTPYISHTELPADIYFQMSRWWRHNSGAIVGFEPVYSHTGASLADGVVKMTSDLELDLSNCRGQSYDNASNMSSQYNGCHAHLKKINPLIHYVQYDAHSLNILNTW